MCRRPLLLCPECGSYTWRHRRLMNSSPHLCHRFRLLLPVIMTCVQLGLLAACLVIHREPWVLSAPPALPTPGSSPCAAENCVSFSPPPEPRFGRIIRLAMILNLPAVFLGACFEILLAVFRVPTNEATLLASSAIFVPLIWSRIGNWIDAQSEFQTVSPSTPTKMGSAWAIVARASVWMSFLIMLFAFVVERHREGEPTRFVQAVAIAWTGIYVAVGLWGDWRRPSRHPIEAPRDGTAP